MTTELPPSPIPLFPTVAPHREWRRKAFNEKKSVGFVALMGALHEGHLSLVHRSLAENNLAVMSIFVNPAQFAPYEDLATFPPYPPPRPRASHHDLLSEMYPSGITQSMAEQSGTFVDVKGYGHEIEGKTRLCGVVTVVIKLFNVIEPTHTYFGQKDI
ncbi:hypothetical protein BD310DRAFT_972604 [Dichomitus squalens]|uniref:Pantoate--beta-alanine ligase n=1 Tax=Dichomitus squalens TaxID=114155 RepID=A0A4V2K9U0_9APHY|nr:hypothetical protein BD310DRAFT_972604 [Dichomitus squalens]